MVRPVYAKRSSKPIQEYLDKKISMLDSEGLPTEYSHIESWQEAEDAAFRSKVRQVRVHIVWDNPLTDMPLSEVLDKMRETGAAMVLKVEQL